MVNTYIDTVLHLAILLFGPCVKLYPKVMTNVSASRGVVVVAACMATCMNCVRLHITIMEGMAFSLSDISFILTCQKNEIKIVQDSRVHVV